MPESSRDREPRRPLPEWAQEASFGIFVHWGPYSVPAWAEPTGALGKVPPEEWFAHNPYAEWYANTIRIEGSPAAAHHLAEYGGAPYEEFLEAWTADRYDPVEWARLFRAAGADYVIPVTKHHDGVALWDAPGSGDLTTVARGPRRDLIQPLADAVRAEGIRFGVYYSGGLDWAFSDLPPLETPEQVHEYRPVDDAYARYATAHVRDLIDRYRPSVIWNDIGWPDAGRQDGSLDELLRHHRKVVPDGIVNDRWGPDVGDYRTSEYSQDTHNESGIGWENNRGLGFSFGYNQVEGAEQTLSPRELAQLYADVVSRGGRLLLNVGPEASGEIPALQRRTLEGIASWMTELKPFTTHRRPASAEDLGAFPLTEAWVGTWVSDGRLIVVTDRPEEFAALAEGMDAVVVGLPDADE
ncbi:alpha-L-fucosidase [Microbacterium pumilum]|uniref:alpha-L-fucosidase n=1 Tax=Microbacterium pumilum TaxID=344165 RepID=A0ABN2RRX6_9MICO